MLFIFGCKVKKNTFAKQKKNMKNLTLPFVIAVMIVSLCLSISCRKPHPEPRKPKLIPTSVTDIDGNTYKIKRINSKLWMTENLRVTHYDTESISSGDTIFEATSKQSVNEQKPYFKDARNFNESPYTDNLTADIRNVLGFLYNWCAAVGKPNNTATVAEKVQGICPNGWRLPNSEDWDSLCYYLGGQEIAGEKLKSANSWYTSSGTNNSGLNCYPSGLAIRNNVSFVGKQTMFWRSKSQPTNNSKAEVLQLIFYQDKVDIKYINKIQANSVRCIMDLDSTYAGF
jgi:uncharacterized protein (TIGR02145 family)